MEIEPNLSEITVSLAPMFGLTLIAKFQPHSVHQSFYLGSLLDTSVFPDHIFQKCGMRNASPKSSKVPIKDRIDYDLACDQITLVRIYQRLESYKYIKLKYS